MLAQRPSKVCNTLPPWLPFAQDKHYVQVDNLVHEGNCGWHPLRLGFDNGWHLNPPRHTPETALFYHDIRWTHNMLSYVIFEPDWVSADPDLFD